MKIAVINRRNGGKTAKIRFFLKILGDNGHILFCFPLPNAFAISNNQFKIHDGGIFRRYREKIAVLINFMKIGIYVLIYSFFIILLQYYKIF